MGELTILFGAGASKGCSAASPRPPPLGSQLFRELEREFPLTWGRIPAQLATAFRANFEIGMGNMLDGGAMTTNYLMREFASFFARFSPTGTTPYDVFLRELAKAKATERIRLATLNYECLLEFAINAAGFKTVYFERRPPETTDLVLWKPHGSCNFIPRGLSIEGVGLDPRIAVDGGTIEPIQPRDVPTWCRSGTSLYPAMALYAKGKPALMTSSVLQQVQSWTADSLRNADGIAVVGVLPNPEDPHIWRPIAESDARVFFVGGQTAFETWHKGESRTVSAEFVGTRFENCAEELARKLAAV